MRKRKAVFHDFSEYWHYVRYCSEYQRNILFNSMPKEDQNKIQKSYKDERWIDVFNRNKIDKLVDEFKEEYDIDLIDVRYKVLKKKSVYLSKKVWDIITTELNRYDIEHTYYVIGNIREEECQKNKDVALLVYNP